jgi:hypothetical protein
MLNLIESGPPPSTDNFGAGGEAGEPQTEQGRELLCKLLVQLNLPPEEWADDVRGLATQLVHALEELAQRDRELEEHEELLRRWVGGARGATCGAALGFACV